MKISESFYSVQCEGDTTGIPSYFIRLTRCNLSCGFSKDAITKLTKDLDGVEEQSGTSDIDKEYADLYKEGKSTWFCDTASVWVKGKDVTNEELEQRLIDDGILSKVLSGKVHLIWTGGEPTMIHHQKAIMEFQDYLHKKYNCTLYSEIETNGTIVTGEKFYKFNPTPTRGKLVNDKNYIQQINCSPKLENSGMPEFRRIVPDAIKQIMSHYNYWFKFVVSKEDDIIEIQDKWIKRFSIPDDRIILMPGVDCFEDIAERTRFLYEMSKKYGYRGITRGHIVAWGKTTGV